MLSLDDHNQSSIKDSPQMAIKEHGLKYISASHMPSQVVKPYPLKFCVMIFVFFFASPEPNDISLRYQTSACNGFRLGGLRDIGKLQAQ